MPVLVRRLVLSRWGGLRSARGLLVADSVLDFWLSRGDRNLASLLEQLRLVTDVALRQQRRITVPLLKDVLQF